MKNAPSFGRSRKQSFVLLLALAMLTGSCDQATQPDVSPASGCLIQRIDSESKSSSSANTAQTLYTYDDSRNLVRTAYTTTTKYTSAALETVFSIITDDTYNTEGYLTATTTRTTDRASGAGVVGIPAMTQRSSTTTYAYTTGRVSSYTIVDINTDGRQSTRTGTYTYDFDPATEQVRQTVIAGADFRRVYTYTRGILTDYVERNGTAETRPWELKNGVITRFTIPGGLVTTYQYDDQLRPIRMDEFVNGKQTRYTTWTNAATKPGSEAVTIQKGFPSLLPPFGRAAVKTSEKLYFINETTGQTQFFSDIQTTNQANSQGFVTSRVSLYRAQNPQTLPQSITTTETYTYTNCP